MHIKKFTGASVKDALKAIKAEFGDSALIMSNKKLPSGLYEVVAAVDYDLSEPMNVNLNDSRLSGASKAYCVEKTARPVAGSANNNRVEKDIKELKDLCWTVINQSKNPVSEVSTKLEEEMVKNGIDSRLARKILMNAFNSLAKDKAADLGYVKSFIKERISEKVSVNDPLAGRSIVTFVGPTGVGKTTTIAKLAAVHALKKKRKVALFTLDTYRIAAADQLKTYGKIIGVPVEVAKSAGELGKLITEHSDKDLILVDTAGRSQRNQAQMNELKELSSINANIKFNLVLNSQTRDETLYEAVRGFGKIKVDSLTFTKLDEGGSYGAILNTMIYAGRPAAYFTAGQRVPEDIEAATKDRLLSFFMPN